MIYLKGPEMIFLKPHKVAGTSFEIALSAFAQNADILASINQDEAIRRKMGFAGPQNHLFPLLELHRMTADDWARAGRKSSWPHKFYNHMSAASVKDRMPAAAWRDATKISILRNPYDVAVSTYFWWKKQNKREISFVEWGMQNHALLTRNQEKYLIDGKVVIDRFIRFESFAVDIAALETGFPSLNGLADVFVSINAKGNVRPKSAGVPEMFNANPGMAKLVESKCAFEIEAGGYALD